MMFFGERGSENRTAEEFRWLVECVDELFPDPKRMKSTDHISKKGLYPHTGLWSSD